MSKPTTTGPTLTHGTYGHSPKFTQLRDDLTSSAAFLSLNCTEQMILIDWIRCYNATTNFDRDEEKLTRPIMYTFAMCGLVITKNTFYRALRTLQVHGFLVDYNGTDYKRGHSSRFLACTRWMSWKPDQGQFRLLTGYRTRRASTLQDDSQLRFPFISYLRKPDAPAAPAQDNIIPVNQAIDAVMEELCTRNDSRRPAQQANR